MNLVMAVVVGVLVTLAIAMLQRRRLVPVLLGVLLLSHAANLAVFVASPPPASSAPLIAEGASGLPDDAADPLPQALVLTAIVIGFGVTAFISALAWRLTATVGNDRVNDLEGTSRGEPSRPATTVAPVPVAAPPGAAPTGHAGTAAAWPNAGPQP